MDRESRKRAKVKIDLKGNNVYIKNPTAVRQKVAKRFNKYHHINTNKLVFPSSGGHQCPYNYRINEKRINESVLDTF